MDSHFETISYSIINQFLDSVSEQCLLDKTQLWVTWKDMFHFPSVPVAKKTVITSKVKEQVSVPTVTIQDKIVTKTAITKATVTKTVVPESVITESTVPESVVPESVVPESVVPDSVVAESVVPESVAQKKKKGTVQEKGLTEAVATETEGCQRVLTRGANVGQKCGKKKKDDQFCGLHAK